MRDIRLAARTREHRHQDDGRTVDREVDSTSAMLTVAVSRGRGMRAGVDQAPDHEAQLAFVRQPPGGSWAGRRPRTSEPSAALENDRLGGYRPASDQLPPRGPSRAGFPRRRPAAGVLPPVPRTFEPEDAQFGRVADPGAPDADAWGCPGQPPRRAADRGNGRRDADGGSAGPPSFLPPKTWTRWSPISSGTRSRRPPNPRSQTPPTRRCTWRSARGVTTLRPRPRTRRTRSRRWWRA